MSLITKVRPIGFLLRLNNESGSFCVTNEHQNCVARSLANLIIGPSLDVSLCRTEIIAYFGIDVTNELLGPKLHVALMTC